MLKGYFTFKKTFGHFVVYSGFLGTPGTVFEFLDSVFRYLIFIFIKHAPFLYKAIVTSNSILTMIDSMKTPVLFSSDSWHTPNTCFVFVFYFFHLLIILENEKNNNNKKRKKKKHGRYKEGGMSHQNQRRVFSIYHG